MSERIREDGRLTAGETLRAYLGDREPAGGESAEELLYCYGSLLASRLDGIRNIDSDGIPENPYDYIARVEELNRDCSTGEDSDGISMPGIVSGRIPEMYAALRRGVTQDAFGQVFALKVEECLDFIHEQEASRISAT